MFMIWTDTRDYFLRKLDRRSMFLEKNIVLNGHHSISNSISTTGPTITVIIPTRDKVELLRRCLETIYNSKNASSIEVIVVDNKSSERKTKLYLEELKSRGIKVLSYPDKFNYSVMNNMAAKEASGEYLCFLNNDIEAIEPSWLLSMLDHASQASVGFVGAILTFPDGNLQHMGVALGYTGVAGHPGRGKNPTKLVPENCFQVSAVTFACAVISAKKYKLLGGLDPDFPVAFNDVDISIRASELNLTNVVCTHANLIHGESQTRSRTMSLRGFCRGVKDVRMLLKKHNRSLTENFFVRRVFSDKL
jgi:GT2 family glycosyltransferase